MEFYEIGTCLFLAIRMRYLIVVLQFCRKSHDEAKAKRRACVFFLYF